MLLPNKKWDQVMMIGMRIYVTHVTSTSERLVQLRRNVDRTLKLKDKHTKPLQLIIRPL